MSGWKFTFSSPESRRITNWVQLRMEDLTLSWQQPSPLRSSRSYYGATQLEERSRRQIDSWSQLQAKTAKDAGFVFLPKPHFRGHLCCARWMVMDHFNALPRDVSFDWICDTIFFCQPYHELFVIPLRLRLRLRLIPNRSKSWYFLVLWWRVCPCTRWLGAKLCGKFWTKNWRVVVLESMRSHVEDASLGGNLTRKSMRRHLFGKCNVLTSKLKLKTLIALRLTGVSKETKGRDN